MWQIALQHTDMLLRLEACRIAIRKQTMCRGFLGNFEMGGGGDGPMGQERSRRDPDHSHTGAHGNARGQRWHAPNNAHASDTMPHADMRLVRNGQGHCT